MKELSYTKNTFYLVISGIISQLFAALQKIILTRYLKEEGMAIYQSALCVYSLFLTLALGGLPLWLTHFISKERSFGNEPRIFAGVRFTFRIICISGFLLSILMFFLRGFFAASMKDFDIKYAISLLSPSVFIVAVGAVAKSCFEGYSNMRPIALSQVLESFIKLILAYIITSYLSIFSAKYAAAGATLTITLGEAFATFLLLAFARPFLKKIKNSDFYKSCTTYKPAVEYALPITVYAIILSSLDLMENAVIRNALLSIKFTADSANALFLNYSRYTHVFDTVSLSGRLSKAGAGWLYGAFFGYAMTIIRFPAGLLKTFSVSLFPIAARHFAEKTETALGKSLSRLIRIMLFTSLALCALIIIFSDRISSLIFGCSAYSSMLVSASGLLIFAPILSLFTSVEYASGRTFAPFLFSFISFMISIPLCFILIRIPKINILGAAIASTVGIACEFFLSYFFVTHRLKIEIQLIPAFFYCIKKRKSAC